MSWKSGFTENDNLGFAANLNIIILYNFLETFEYEEPSRTEKETKYYLFKGFSTRLDALCIWILTVRSSLYKKLKFM